MQPACLELWEQNSYQALGWRAGMEGFDKPGQLGAGVSSSTFQQPPGLCFLHILCRPFSGKCGCRIGIPGGSWKLCPSHSCFFCVHGCWVFLGRATSWM